MNLTCRERNKMLVVDNSKEADVVILCGGLGKRLKSVISDRPKPMAEIKNRPFLDILVDYVASYGFKRFILCIGYNGNVIKKYYQSNKDNSVTILFSEESEPLGTGGAIKNAESLIKSNPFLVLNGDSFCQVDLHKFLDFHIKKRALLSMVLTGISKDRDYGVINLGRSQRIIKFDEKVESKSSNFINCGIYSFDIRIFSLMPVNRNFSLEYELFPKIINSKFYGYITEGTFIDIGTPGKYRKAKKILVDINLP